jgi:hypothetical protein
VAVGVTGGVGVGVGACVWVAPETVRERDGVRSEWDGVRSERDGVGWDTVGVGKEDESVFRLRLLLGVGPVREAVP